MKSKLIFMAALALMLAGSMQSCSSGMKKREKIKDPALREEFRTRDKDIPVKEIFGEKARKEVFSPFSRISWKQFRADWKELTAEAPAKILEEKIKNGEEGKKLNVSGWDKFEYASDNISKKAGDRYSTSLTVYFYFMLLVFAGVLLWKIIATFFISPKR